MVLGIGIFVIGLVFLAILGFLIGVVFDGEVTVGFIIVSFIPITIGIYYVGKFIASEFGWI